VFFEIFVILPKLPGVILEEFLTVFGALPGNSGRKQDKLPSSSGILMFSSPKPADFPNQYHTDPDLSTTFLGSIRNAPK
jgi:hypothetical protein